MNTFRIWSIRPFRIAMALLYRIPWRHRACNLCGHKFGAFLPYSQSAAPMLLRVLGLVGSKLNTFQCPWCGCHDRERHVFMYMNACGILPNLSGKHVLHFAPERRLSPKIQAASPERYIRCDLFPQDNTVVRVDMLNIPFDEGCFDLLIANHVLEHVSDDARALSEIARVLKPGGFAILQTPFCAKLHATWEDIGIDTDQARREAYGQEDHVRLYGGNIFDLFSNFGLVACIKNHAELLSNVDSNRFGVNDLEPFFLFKKDA